MFKFTASTIYLLLLIPFFTTTVWAQDRSDYKLLWEIQHKDNDKKSYLFGTIHLKDKRVFNFSDAVIPAIRNSEAFALEIHPDSLSSGINDVLFNPNEENIYRKILSEEEYKRLDERYQKVQGIPLDSALFNSPFMIESLLSEEVEREDDKRTFLDAYLYGIAFSYEKEIYGLEKIKDQIPDMEDVSEEELRANILSILDSEEGAYEKYLDEMVQLYYGGNIDEIFMRSIGLFSIDHVLNKRNHVMANSIEKVMQTRSIFAAVGTAHLPGNEGVIQLLREKGFTVSNVAATFNNDPEEFQIIPNLNKWHTDERPKLGYSVMTPTEAAPLDYNSNLEIMMATDLIFGGVFGYMAIDLRTQSLKEDFSFVDNVIEQQTQGIAENLISRKDYERDGILFSDLTMLTNEGHGRMILAMQNQIAYSFFTQNTLDELHTPYVNAFFDSIKIFDPLVEASEWNVFDNEIGAFKVDFPGEVSDVSRDVANPYGESLEPYHLNIYLGQDAANEMLYLFRFNDQPLGYYLQEDSTHEEFFTEYFNTRGTVIGKPKPYKVGDYEGLEIEMLLSDKFHTFARVFFRGNRTYMLLSQKTVPEKKVDRDNPFFNSFQLSPFQYKAFDSIVTIDDRYSFRVSKELSKEVDSLYYYISEYDKTTSYMGLQKGSGGIYGLVHTTIKPYHSLESLQGFYDEYSETLKEDNDTILKSNPVTIGGKPGRELVIANSLTKVRQRMQMLLDNDNVFLMQIYVAEEELNTSFANDFFKSFKILKNKKTFDPFASKTKLILTDLRSKDSITFDQAKDALSYYVFAEKDMKPLLKALYQNYRFDSKSGETKNDIINALINVGGSSALAALDAYYREPKTANAQRIHLLENLLYLENDKTEATFFNLIENHKPKRTENSYYNVFSLLGDSLPRMVNNEKRLVDLLKIEDYRDKVVSLYESNIVRDSMVSPQMGKLKNAILTYIQPDVAKYVDTLSRKASNYLTYGLIDDYISIIKHTETKDNASRKALQYLYADLEGDSWLKARALMLAISFQFDIEESILNKSLEDLYTRFEIMEALLKADLKQKIPPKYMEAEAFTKLSLYNQIGAQDDYPAVIEKLGDFTYKDQTYTSYAFGYSNDDEDHRYLGITAYDSANPNNFKQNTTYSHWDEIKTDWKAQSIELLSEIIEN